MVLKTLALDIYNFIGAILSPNQLHNHIETALNSWPLALIVLGIIFRKQLIFVLSKIRSLNYKDGSREIALNWEEDVKNLTDIKGKSDSEKTPKDQQTIDELNALAKRVKISTRSAVLEAWLHLEEITKDLINSYSEDTKVNQYRPITERDLLKIDLVTPRDLEIFARLKRLRNQAAHMKSFEISEEGAIEYIENALSLSIKFENIKNKKSALN